MIERPAALGRVVASIAIMASVAGCDRSTTNPEQSEPPAESAAAEPANGATTPAISADGSYGEAGNWCQFCQACPGVIELGGSDEEVSVSVDEIPPQVIAAARQLLHEVEQEIAAAVWIEEVQSYSLFFHSEVFVAEDGTVTVMIEGITEDRVPSAAGAALSHATDGLIVTRFEKETAYADDEAGGESFERYDPPMVVYSAQYSDGHRVGELEVDPTGHVVAPPVWEINLLDPDAPPEPMAPSISAE